jgi:DNA (cytosine-5)-methyltransferase 1
MVRTTVELFAGIGGFRVAADTLGIKTVWANDINPLSACVYRHRFEGNAFYEGDIAHLMDSIPEHDILTAGFPCQPFSAAGKKAGIRDPRGTLFERIVEIVKIRQPSFFVLENVKRLLSMEQGAHFATVLSALAALDYFIEWRVLNAKHFGLAQNRERVVIVGTRKKTTWDEDSGVLPQIRLAAIDRISDSIPNFFQAIEQHRNWKPLTTHGIKFPNWGIAFEGRFIAHDLLDFHAVKASVSLRDVLEETVSDDYDLTDATLHRLADNVPVHKLVNGVEILSNQGGGARMGYTIFGTSGLAPTLTASTSRHYERYFINGRYRRLTPAEYARLQGFSDDHCSLVRPYDQYALLGNAVPPPMVKWVLQQLILKRDNTKLKPTCTQSDLFYV